jgi:GNAT superfamily N-acetyltransferase
VLDARIRIEQMAECSPSFCRYLYVEVGRNYHWIDRLQWTDEDIARHLHKAENSLWLMTCEGQTAGYFELRKCEDGSIEIAYFGLLQDFLGRGLGRHLLTCATEQAWADGANPAAAHLHA